MNKLIAVFTAVILGVSLSACGQQESSSADSYKNYCAYIQKIDENTIYVDEAEWITDEDEERVSELQLTDAEMPDGYYIYNPSNEVSTFELNDKTEYNFIDWGHDFSADSDKYVRTTDKDTFIQYLNTYTDSIPGMPFFFDIDDGQVKSITEKPLA